MKINWMVRIKNKQFWIHLIPALALVVQAVAAVFGYTLDFSTLVGKVLTVVDAVFALLVILGIAVDPTTAGLSDSERALGYETPWDDDKPPELEPADEQEAKQEEKGPDEKGADEA